jgi:hypothetical protein
MSTYSPDLRITLISNGDEVGTWGSTTNTNLGTIIEDAISGYTTVSVTSANQAFTANNGTADQARNAMIRLTTTTTAAFSVYAPPSSKQYIIWNNSGYAATIYNSTVIGNTTAAGTGVTIADGNKIIVFSNGTNFYETSVGNVAIANGGTGQSTANAAFNALAPSQASASGKYLKSNGTNTSWDALDVGTADITGVLPAANGGTGLSSSGTSGNVLTSTGSGWASSAPSGIGIGQTWQNMTSSRASGTSYTNSTGKPIMVNVYNDQPDNGFSIRATCGGIVVGNASGAAGGDSTRAGMVSFIVPDGTSYSVTYSVGIYSSIVWAELR